MEPIAETVAALNLDRANCTTQTQSKKLDSEMIARMASDKWRNVSQKLGSRYMDCRLSNFEIDAEPKSAERQGRVLELLTAYLCDMENQVKQGRGIVLHGPPGTGKDHLLVAMIRKACYHNLSVEWRNGMDLFAERRDGIQSGDSERSLIQSFVGPDVLAISDPVPPWGNLTDGQAEFLFRIVDARYRQAKPIWVTANFAKGDEAESRLGSQVVDRLRDGSLALHCNWPSYRKAN